MKRLIALSALAAALMTSGCITVIDADTDGVNWTGQNAQPFDRARDDCREETDGGQRSRAFAACMAEKGWTRDD